MATADEARGSRGRGGGDGSRGDGAKVVDDVLHRVEVPVDYEPATS